MPLAPLLLFFFLSPFVHSCYFLNHMLRSSVTLWILCLAVSPFIYKNHTSKLLVRFYQLLFPVCVTQSYCMTSSQMTGTSTLLWGSERTSCWRHDLMFTFAVSLKGKHKKIVYYIAGQIPVWKTRVLTKETWKSGGYSGRWFSISSEVFSPTQSVKVPTVIKQRWQQLSGDIERENPFTQWQ